MPITDYKILSSIKSIKKVTKEELEYLLQPPVEGCLPSRKHMELCLQVLDDRSVKTGNCLSAASFAG